MRRLYILSLFSLLSAAAANAQVSSSAPWASANKDAQTLGAKPVPTPPSGSPTNAPLDGGLGILLAAGALYGNRAYRKHKRTTAAAL